MSVRSPSLLLGKPGLKSFMGLKIAAVILFFAGTSLLFGDGSLVQQVEDLKREVDSLKQEVYKKKTPLSGEFIFDLSFLFLQGHENGLSYAIENSDAALIINEGKSKQLNFKHDLAFQVGMGYRFAFDGWKISLEYFRIHTDADGNAHTQSPHLLFPIWTNANTTGSGSVDHADAHWRLHLGFLDLLLKKDFVHTHLLFRPVIGLRNGWIRQKYQLIYEGGTLFPGSKDDISMKNKFWGIGPLAGLFSSWRFAEHWAIYANGSFSLLWGYFYVHQSEKAESGEPKRLELHERFHLSRPLIDFSIGAQWNHLIAKEHALTLRGGWSQLLLLGQNQFKRFLSSPMQGGFVSNQGDLTLQGWLFESNVSF